MDRIRLLYTILFFIVGCTTTHPTQTFILHYPVRPKTWSFVTYIKKKELSLIENRTPLQNQKLYELIMLERSTLSPQSQAYVSLEQQMASLNLGEYKPSVEQEIPKPAAKQELPKIIQPIYSLWREERPDKALLELNKLLLKISDKEALLHGHAIAARIAVEYKNMALLETSYEKLNELSPCDMKTKQIRLITAILGAFEKKIDRFKTLITVVCENDSWIDIQVRRYWMFRFLKDEDVFDRYFKQAKIPTYYSLMAQKLSQKNFNITADKAIYKNTEILTLSTQRAYYLSQVENNLNNELYEQARTVLRKHLPFGVDIELLSYWIHLLQASEEHLTALALFSSYVTTDDENQISKLSKLISLLYPRPYLEYVEWFSKINSVDPFFVYSIMRQESGFNIMAVSRSGARGLLQLMPTLAQSLFVRYGKNFNVKNLFYAKDNIRLATYHMAELFDLYRHPILVAAAYNAGRERVDRWLQRWKEYPLDIFIELIPIQETKTYCMLVFRNYVTYYYLYQNEPVSTDFVSSQLE